MAADHPPERLRPPPPPPPHPSRGRGRSTACANPPCWLRRRPEPGLGIEVQVGAGERRRRTNSKRCPSRRTGRRHTVPDGARLRLCRSRLAPGPRLLVAGGGYGPVADTGRTRASSKHLQAADSGRRLTRAGGTVCVCVCVCGRRACVRFELSDGGPGGGPTRASRPGRRRHACACARARVRACARVLFELGDGGGGPAAQEAESDGDRAGPADSEQGSRSSAAGWSPPPPPPLSSLRARAAGCQGLARPGPCTGAGTRTAAESRVKNTVAGRRVTRTQRGAAGSESGNRGEWWGLGPGGPLHPSRGTDPV